MEVVSLLKKGAVARNFIALEESVRQESLAGRRPDESLDLRLKGISPIFLNRQRQTPPG